MQDMCMYHRLRSETSASPPWLDIASVSGKDGGWDIGNIQLKVFSLWGQSWDERKQYCVQRIICFAKNIKCAFFHNDSDKVENGGNSKRWIFCECWIKCSYLILLHIWHFHLMKLISSSNIDLLVTSHLSFSVSLSLPPWGLPRTPLPQDFLSPSGLHGSPRTGSCQTWSGILLEWLKNPKI